MGLLPAVDCTIGRRLLVNYRIDPSLVEPMIPRGFRPQIVNGFAVAGMCLLRLKDVRPKGLPRALGITTQNAAHRVAVQRDTPGGIERSVFIPMRHTSSRLVPLIGGRLFPGVHRRAAFQVIETNNLIALHIEDSKSDMVISVEATPSKTVEPDSVFKTLDEASKFFEVAPTGYSPGLDGTELESVTLSTKNWSFEPVALNRLNSSFFNDQKRFPPNAIAFDSAFVMKNVHTTWTP